MNWSRKKDKAEHKRAETEDRGRVEQRCLAGYRGVTNVPCHDMAFPLEMKKKIRGL